MSKIKSKFIKSHSSDELILYILLATGVLTLISNFWLFNTVFLFSCWWVISRTIKRDFFNTVISGMVLGFAISSTAIITASALFWLFGNPLTLIQLGVVGNILVIAFLYFDQGYRPPATLSRERIKLFDRTDILVLAVVITFLSAYLYSSRTPGGFSVKVDAVRNTTKALDDQNHFTMFTDTLRANDGLEIGKYSAYKPNSLLSVYPKGIHTVSGVFAESIRPLWARGNRNAPGTLDELYIYALLKLVFYLVTIFTLTRFTLEICQRLARHNKQVLLTGALTALVCAYIVLIYMTPLYMDGAFSFIPTFLFSALFLLFCGMQNRPRYSYALLGLFAASSTLTWTIAGIPLFLVIGILIAMEVLFVKKRNIRDASIIIASVAVTGIAGLVQVYVQAAGNVAVLNVNTAGGFFSIPILLPLVSVSFLVYATQRVLSNDPFVRQTIRFALLMLMLFFLVCAGISLQNLNQTGEVQYYFIKLLYLPFVMSALLAASYMAIALASGPDSGNVKSEEIPYHILNVVVPKLATLILILSVLFIAFPPNLGVVDYYMKGSRSLSKHTAFLLMDELSRVSYDNSKAVFILSDTVPITENIMVNHAINASSQGNLCQGAIFDALYAQKNLSIFNDTTIKECVKYKAKNIRIVTDSNIFDELPTKYKGSDVSIEVVHK